MYYTNNTISLSLPYKFVKSIRCKTKNIYYNMTRVSILLFGLLLSNISYFSVIDYTTNNVSV